ncbi:hypothetical protein D0T12_03605 [Actinomadura spongiicola]|uniref:Cysteinyl-tRNA ligase anticodon binding domain-containing protein n=1 Tax=Actinomadura spongiicola TaxID=2303421 RepID=A0A372GPK9_9ACTN|nr:hypothetical protein [Actinomadura spongiicola]RFS87331.1 hypothetical protein D0T12_03605 [Actinomadura spongiicola]
MLVLMGSGETSPTMVSVHRELVDRLRPKSAVLLDTPYGFQENVAEISARAQAYFERSVGLTVDVPPGLRGLAEIGAGDDPRHDGARARAADVGLAAVRGADWLFAGPGSPTYALTQWRGGPVGDALADHVRTGRAALVFASAAACTLGAYALPVYEIYKAGARPHWLKGLDVLGRLGLKVAMIPHYDNAEGGTHDTRYCYLGERRLRVLERELPDDAAVLGLDEHTAAVMDVGRGLVEVRGRGSMTVRRSGESVVVPSGERLALTDLRAMVRGEAARRAPVPPRDGDTEAVPPPATLRDTVVGCERRFEAGVREGDAEALVRAVLDIDAAVAEWAGDTEEDEGGTDWARDVMRSLVVRLGQTAGRGLADPRDALAPTVEPLIRVRAELRRTGSYSLADVVRDALKAAGVEVRDTPDGTHWQPDAT